MKIHFSSLRGKTVSHFSSRISRDRDSCQGLVVVASVVLLVGGCFRVKLVLCWALITSSVTQLLLNSKHNVRLAKKASKYNSELVFQFSKFAERGDTDKLKHIVHFTSTQCKILILAQSALFAGE